MLYRANFMSIALGTCLRKFERIFIPYYLLRLCFVLHFALDSRTAALSRKLQNVLRKAYSLTVVVVTHTFRLVRIRVDGFKWGGKYRLGCMAYL
jgi:hypothetical protein